MAHPAPPAWHPTHPTRLDSPPSHSHSRQPDPRLRGICIYRTGSVATALELASSDPAVRAGQLEVEAMTWFTRAGALAIGTD